MAVVIEMELLDSCNTGVSSLLLILMSAKSFERESCVFINYKMLKINYVKFSIVILFSLFSSLWNFYNHIEMILKLAKALSKLLLFVVPLLTLLVLVSVFIGDGGNFTKVVFAEQTSRGSGFSYLTGENDNIVYPDGMYL